MDAVYSILVRVEQGELTLNEACRSLGVHRSTLWRKLNRVRDQGAGGLRHKLAGRPSNRRLPDGLRSRAIAVYRDVVLQRGVPVAEFYRDLATSHGVNASYATLTRWLRAEGLTTSAPRRRQRVAGETVVVCRVEGAMPLMIVDCATGRVVGQSAQTDYKGVREALVNMVQQHGLPMRIVMDRAMLASFTSRDKRHLRHACEGLGVSLGNAIPRTFDMASVSHDAATDDTDSAFVVPSDDRWRKLLL